MSDILIQFLRDNRWLPFRSIEVFNFLLEATLCGALMIALLLLVRRFLRGRLGNRAVYFAWLLVAVRLLVPLALPNPLMNELRPSLSTDEAARPIADQIRVRTQDALLDLGQALDTGDTIMRGQESSLARFTFDLGVYSSYGWVGKWVLIGYLTVDGLVLAYIVIQNARFRTRLKKRRVEALTGEAYDRYLALCQARRVKPIPVYYVDPLPGACLVGVLRPYIALPLTLSSAELPQALLHELCHHKARDEWWGLLRTLCCVVHWFNPLVWVAAKAARVDCELACDDRVTQPMSDTERLAYANALVLTAAKRSAPGLTMLATGMTMTGKRLKRRINAILHSRAVRRWAVIAFVILSLATLVLAFGTAEDHSQDYDVRLQKAIYGNLLDDPYSVGSLRRADIPAQALDSGEAAAQQALAYLETEYLSNLAEGEIAAETLRYSAVHTGAEWDVVAAGTGDELYELRLDGLGKLVRYDAVPFRGAFLLNDGRLPGNIDEAMQTFIAAFTADCLQGQPVDSVERLEDQYDLEGRYLLYAATGGDWRGQFLIQAGPYLRLLQYEDETSPEPGMTQAQALRQLHSYLTEVVGLSADELAGALLDAAPVTVGAETIWHATCQISARVLSESSLSTLQSMYPAADSYTLEQLYTASGTALTYRTLDAYQRRDEPEISESQARVAALAALAAYTGLPEEQLELTAAGKRDRWAYYQIHYQSGESRSEGSDGKPWGYVNIDLHSGKALSLTDYTRDGASAYVSLGEPIIASSAAESIDLTPLPATPTPLPTAAAPTLLKLPPAEAGGATIVFRTLDKAHDNGSFTQPGAEDMALEAALRLAVDAIAARYGETADTLARFQVSYGFCAAATDFTAPYWQFDFWRADDALDSYEVILHSPDGEVLYATSAEGGNG